MKIKIVAIICSLLLLIITIGSCRKPKDNNVSSLTIETSPASGSNQTAAPGPNFPLTVTVTSTMPTSGISIEVIARAEGSITPFFTTSVNSNNAVNNFTITSAPQGVTSVVEITVTSLSNPSARAISSYRFAKK